MEEAEAQGRTFPTRAEFLREKLTEEIIAGKLAPGTRLDEKEIADRFGVSRTPVREAVRHLVAIGLAQSQPHHGATVSGFDSRRMTAFLDAATELEVACARMAAMCMTSEEQQEFLALHNQMAQTLFDEERYFDLNDRFHDLIYKGSHNEVLVELALGLRARIGPVYRAQSTIAHRARQSHVEHEHIAMAILRGDAVASEVAMRAHMTSSAMMLERLHGNVLGTLNNDNGRRTAEQSADDDKGE